MKIFVLAFMVFGLSSAMAELPPRPVDYIEVVYAGMRRGEVYLKITNISKVVVSYVCDGDSKKPIHRVDVYRPFRWTYDSGIGCATGRRIAELKPGESHVFLASFGRLRPVLGNLLRVRITKCMRGPKSAWTKDAKPEKYVSANLRVTKKPVKEPPLKVQVKAEGK